MDATLTTDIATSAADTVRLTTDTAAAERDLREHGYCLLESVLSAVELHALRERLTALAAQEREDGSAFVYDNDSQRVFSLHKKGREFLEIIEHPIVLSLMETVLGFNFLLSSSHANIAGPGGDPMHLHADQTFVPAPWPPYALVANSMWMLDDFTPENGATRLVPGSHLLGRQPSYVEGEDDTVTVPVCAPAGSVMIFDGRLWHQTGANVTKDEFRHGILNYYCRGFIRQQQNFFLELQPEVFRSASPVFRRLLGWENYFSLGLHDGLPELPS
jgi:ectoine hydroxylase-related dioxygenase (phytanoyl-CoA dioxygenase family)